MNNTRISHKDFYSLSDFEKEKIIGSVIDIAFKEIKSGSSVFVADRMSYLKSNCTRALVDIILKNHAQWKRTISERVKQRIGYRNRFHCGVDIIL